MKLIKFKYKKDILWGILQSNDILVLEKEPFEEIVVTAKKIPFPRCRLLAPSGPSKIILTGLNYVNHAKELKMKLPQEPIIFLKPPTTLIGNKDKIIYPKGVKRLDYEAELALIIKKKCKNITQRDAPKFILGYSCLNDVTARDLQSKDIQWTRAKSFDAFCPLGPWIETDISPNDLRIQLYLNDKLKQNSSTSQFIFNVNYLVSFISKVMTLLPGDIISTGTPPGVGPMKKGDKVEVKIEGIGTLTNKVI